MANLNRDVLKELILKDNIIEGFDDLDKQLTANGFDVRACAVVEILEGGKLAVEKKDNVPPKLGRAFVLPGYEDRLAGYDVQETMTTDSFVQLKKSQPYFLITCEKVNTPEHLMGTNIHRTSLFRFTQSMMAFGFTEAGYKGYLTFVLIPFLDSSLQLGSRVAQMSFSLLTGKSNYEQQKEASYQGGRLF